MRGMITIVAALLLAGCASSETVLLRNMSGATVKCGPYTSGGNRAAAEFSSQLKLRDCITDYQRQGFERVPG